MESAIIDQKQRILQERAELPIYESKEQILSLVKSNLFSLVTGETGSGKSTQLAQYIIDGIRASDLQILPAETMRDKYGHQDQDLENSKKLAHRGSQGHSSTLMKVVVTQPRRVAAIQMAKRVSYERSCRLGQQVGYTIRFDDNSDSQLTQIKYVTDGVLVRDCLLDANLSSYQVIILDEAHERSLNTDILFTLVKQAVLRRRGTLRLIITSATLKTSKISEFYLGCPILSVSGRCYPVSIMHNPTPKEQRAEATISTAIRIHLHEPQGDILCFLTGFEECERAVKMSLDKLEELANDQHKDIAPVIIVALYGSQSPQQQANAFVRTPENHRKIVYATNIAETSLTVDGVGYVIDCGQVKQKQYNSQTGMESLELVNISKVQSIQRAGRAGRTREGKCIRLYSEQFYEEQMPNQTMPEILRVNLTSTVLTLKSLGIDDVLGFEYMDKPNQDQLEHSLMQLRYLEAVDRRGSLTHLGREIAKFPLEPSFTKALLYADLHGTILARERADRNDRRRGKEPRNTVLSDLLKLVSVLSTENIWMSVAKNDERGQQSMAAVRRKFRDPDGDHLGLVRAYDAWFTEKLVSNAAELNDWCRRQHLQNRALMMAKNIKDQLSDCMRSVDWTHIKVSLNEDIACIQRPVASSPNNSSVNLRACLALAFFMNACRRVPGTKQTGAYLAIKDGLMMKLGQTQSLYQEGQSPDWLVFTEASGSTAGSGGSGVIRMASKIDLEWIQTKIPLLKETDANELCGLKPKEESKHSTAEVTYPAVGAKRPPQEDTHELHGTVSSSKDQDSQNKSKEAKLKELKERFAKRQRH